jgi:O-succinylbenzoate synthase
MQIESYKLFLNEISTHASYSRESLVIQLISADQKVSWGEVAPLKGKNSETLKDCKNQLCNLLPKILKTDWEENLIGETLAGLKALPSVNFGISTAIRSLFLSQPINVEAFALLMGDHTEILNQAQKLINLGITKAKLKVGNLDFYQAKELLHYLSKHFLLRIDFNNKWRRSLIEEFLKTFDPTSFEFIEDDDLNFSKYKHFQALDLQNLANLRSLKADFLVWKPTVLGEGHKNDWKLIKETSSIVASSCFESEIGLAGLIQFAKTKQLKLAVGMGTYHFTKMRLFPNWIKWEQNLVHLCIDPVDQKVPSFLKEIS